MLQAFGLATGHPKVARFAVMVTTCVLMSLIISALVMICSHGRGHPKVARFAVMVVVTTCVLMSLIISALVMILRVPLSKLYTSSSDVIKEVSNLTPLLAISIFLNGISQFSQELLLGVDGKQSWPMLILVHITSLDFQLDVFLASKQALQQLRRRSNDNIRLASTSRRGKAKRRVNHLLLLEKECARR